ncbi:unnamed protein product, partial [Amoebophrya sp. A25]|eukprot:GSA25T00007679001.1
MTCGDAGASAAISAKPFCLPVQAVAAPLSFRDFLEKYSDRAFPDLHEWVSSVPRHVVGLRAAGIGPEKRYPCFMERDENSCRGARAGDVNIRKEDAILAHALLNLNDIR